MIRFNFKVLRESRSRKHDYLLSKLASERVSHVKNKKEKIFRNVSEGIVWIFISGIASLAF